MINSLSIYIQKIKLAEQQINELTESVNRLKTQLQDTEKQLLRLNQNEQKLKQECENSREQLAEVQRNETQLRVDLANAQKKVQYEKLPCVDNCLFLSIKNCV